MNKLQTTFIYLGIFAVLLRNFLVYYIGYLTPGYSPITNFISELSAEGTPYANLMNFGSLVLIGLLFILCSIALNKRLENPGASLSMGYLAIAGVGFICIGLYPCPPGCNPKLDSSQMTLHLLSAFIATLATSLSALVYGLWVFKSQNTPFRKITLALGISGILTFVALWINIVSFEAGIELGFLKVKGLLQRINVAAGDLWVLLACISCLVHIPRMAETSSSANS